MIESNEKINISSSEDIIKNNRQEKIITRKGIIITCILLFFVSIFLDLYFIYISEIKIVMKVILCIIHPLLFVIFSFIPSGLYIEFNYNEKKKYLNIIRHVLFLIYGKNARKAKLILKILKNLILILLPFYG